MKAATPVTNSQTLAISMMESASVLKSQASISFLSFYNFQTKELNFQTRISLLEIYTKLGQGGEPSDAITIMRMDHATGVQMVVGVGKERRGKKGGVGSSCASSKGKIQAERVLGRRGKQQTRN